MVTIDRHRFAPLFLLTFLRFSFLSSKQQAAQRRLREVLCLRAADVAQRGPPLVVGAPSHTLSHERVNPMPTKSAIVS